jgi:hypothetical protein
MCMCGFMLINKPAWHNPAATLLPILVSGSVNIGMPCTRVGERSGSNTVIAAQYRPQRISAGAVRVVTAKQWL